MQMAIKQQQGFLQSLIESSKTTDTPISCIISDLVFPWAQDVANKCGIPRALFWLSSAAIFHIGSVAKAGGIYPGAPELLNLQESLHISARAMLDVFYEDKEQLMGFYERVDEASHILMNNFEALESHILPLLPRSTRFIGPCLPPLIIPASDHLLHGDQHDQLRQDHLQQPASAAAAARFGSLDKEDMACLSWLDEQEDSSVLFISFGSVAALSSAQLAEMALGLEASNHKFLWVARTDTDATFPEGFLERTKESGMVIPWAPQLHVLRHRAVGGFLTHWAGTPPSRVSTWVCPCFLFLFLRTSSSTKRQSQQVQPPGILICMLVRMKNTKK